MSGDQAQLEAVQLSNGSNWNHKDKLKSVPFQSTQSQSVECWSENRGHIYMVFLDKNANLNHDFHFSFFYISKFLVSMPCGKQPSTNMRTQSQHQPLLMMFCKWKCSWIVIPCLKILVWVCFHLCRVYSLDELLFTSRFPWEQANYSRSQ